MRPDDRYLVVSCRLGAGGEESLGDALLDLPTLGCEIVPAETGGSEAKIYLSMDASWAVAALLERLAACGATAIVEGELEAEDWVRAFRERAVAFPVGATWWIDPRPGTGEPPPPGRRRLAVEPRMAFGSGSHESTRLILMELETLPVAGRRVLDVGTGSGILAVAASLLGGRPVVGLDIDLAAVFEAVQTASEQELPGSIHFLGGTVAALDPGRPFDLVLCNMIWERMRSLLPSLVRLTASGGLAVLSGLLRVQEAAVAEELSGTGFHVISSRGLGEWLGLVAAHG
ncbi:MAG: methyltransferase domain-containing protein [Acidobacteria bacterium]|nr:methyltransferase domain-containing protein [Acidobacteriota bacterium]